MITVEGSQEKLLGFTVITLCWIKISLSTFSDNININYIVLKLSSFGQCILQLSLFTFKVIRKNELIQL